MVAVVIVTHPPGIAAEDAVEALNGVDDGRSSLAEEAADTEVAVVKYGKA